jgi:hypothetical protein
VLSGTTNLISSSVFSIVLKIPVVAGTSLSLRMSTGGTTRVNVSEERVSSQMYAAQGELASNLGQ